MLFDNKSNVTLVVTSCGRFDLLKQTLESFDRHNTYPINRVLITEDSGNNFLTNNLPKGWVEHTDIFVNKPKLGQIRSIDLAYSHVETEYIFHCEDDWLFYRDGFVEESIKILESDKNVLQVWMRDYDKDTRIHCPFHFRGEKFQLEQLIFYRLCSNDDIWKGFSFNPGLRRKEDYLKLAPFYNGVSSDIREGEISQRYHSMGLFAVILDESAVEHIGWDEHIPTEKNLKSYKRKNRKKIKYSIIGFVIGCIVTSILFYLLFL